MNNEKFNNSRIFDCIKRSICIFTCFILCIFLFPPSVSLAVDSESIEVLYYNSPDTALIGGPHEGISYGSYNGTYYNVFKDSESYNCYFFSAMRNGDRYVYFVVDNDETYQNASSSFVYGHWAARAGSAVTKQMLSLDTTYNLGVARSTNYFSSTYTLNCMHFDSVDAGLAYVRDYIDNGGSNPLPNDGFDGTLLIEAGYAAYIRVNGGDMELTCTMNELSGLIMGGSPWGNTSSIAYGVGSLPDSSTKFPLSSMSHIPWMKRAQGQNWLGQTRYAGYPRSGLTTSDNYIVIYNPAQPYLSSKGTDELSPTITAHFTKLVDYYKYPLTQRYDSETGGTSSDSISGYTDFYSGTPDSNGDFSEVPSSGSIPPVAIPGGTGDLATSGSASITDYINQLTQTLSNFANSVVELLKAPISHIGELISAGSGFMSSLRGMYAWLPVDIQGLIIAALTVVIGIGVFKVFL